MRKEDVKRCCDVVHVCMAENQVFYESCPLIEFPLGRMDQVSIKSLSAVLYRYMYYKSVMNKGAQGLMRMKLVSIHGGLKRHVGGGEEVASLYQ